MTYPFDLRQQIKCFGHGICTPWDLVSAFNFLQSTGTPYEACFPLRGGNGIRLHPACDSARCPCWNQADHEGAGVSLPLPGTGILQHSTTSDG